MPNFTALSFFHRFCFEYRDEVPLTHTYTHIHIHTHTYTYIHIHTHTYTYTHKHTPNPSFSHPPTPPSSPLPPFSSPLSPLFFPSSPLFLSLLQLQKLDYDIKNLDFFGDQKKMLVVMKECRGFVDKFLDADPSLGCRGLVGMFFEWVEEYLVCLYLVYLIIYIYIYIYIYILVYLRIIYV